jgi:hypothetical protein
MPEYLVVAPGPKTPKGKCALWEVHPDHPKTREFPQGGETFVANLVPRVVARTPEVNLRLADKRLKEVTDKATLGTTMPALDPTTNKELASRALPPVDPNAGTGTGEAPPSEFSPESQQQANDPDIKG